MPKAYEAPKKEDQLPQGSWVSEKPGRYQIIADRYFDGVVVEAVVDGVLRDRVSSSEVIKASPESPVVIKLPAGSKIDHKMTLLAEDQDAQPVVLKPFHAGEAIKRRGAAAHFGKINKANAEEQAE